MRLAFGSLALLAASIAAAIATAPPPAPAPAPFTGTLGPDARIASATLSTDEILLELLPPDRIVAVTAFADDPAVSNTVDLARAVPGRVTGDAETVLPLEPDVLFVDPFGRAEGRALLARAGVPVVDVPPCASLADIARNVRTVGAIVGRADAAERMVLAMDHRVERVRARLHGIRRPGALLYNLGGYTAGAGTLFDEQLRLAGGRNLAAEAGYEGYAAIPIERALALDPEVVLVTDYRADGVARDPTERASLRDDPTWAGVRAVRDGRVFVLDGRTALSTSHHAARAVEDLARALHPARMQAP